MADSIDQIERIRSRNNELWMSILRIALEVAPDRTKAVLAVINKNDREISSLLEKLSK